jgi:phosphoribosylanthranilate isomerase
MVRIKICGVTTVADAHALSDMDIQAVGLNFYPKSPRYVTRDHAKVLCEALGPFLPAIGVFVSGDIPTEFCDIGTLNLQAWQTYSDGPANLGTHPPHHIPAYRIRDAADLDRVQRELEQRKPAAVLLDSFVVGEMGGTGHRAPWHLLAGFNPGVPVILAGGLTPENVVEAIRVVRPWGVDVASGVEQSPGVKDLAKVQAFIDAVRGALEASGAA